MRDGALQLILAALLGLILYLATRQPARPNCYLEINGHSIVVSGDCWHTSAKSTNR
ncbi:TGBp3 [Turtle grass virus X]|uniref:Movement protein TGBp3 n=1 Tax=Turtle grass virus X TaxID=2292642 RepID=A0A345X1J5_9VIRU|nr:TGBp3 [Turtle grass virus X]AXK15641.1 TGBp3 [Turtle grass virus X]